MLSLRFKTLGFLFITGLLLLLSIFVFLKTTQAIWWYWENSLLICTECIKSFTRYFGDIQHLELITLATLFGVGILRALVFAIRQIWLLTKVQKEFQQTVSKNPMTNHTINDKRIFALTTGLFSPDIYISSGLKERLTTEELAAVLEHEKYHQQADHPLHYFLWHFLQQLFFFFPFLKNLFQYWQLRQELAADNASLQKTSQRALAGALLKVGELQQSSPLLFASAGFSDMADRVDYVLHQQHPKLHWSAATITSTIGTLIVFIFVGIVFFSSAVFTATEEKRNLLPSFHCELRDENLFH